MKEFLSLSEDRRRTVCEQAQDKLGLPPATIEKDFEMYAVKMLLANGWRQGLGTEWAREAA